MPSAAPVRQIAKAPPAGKHGAALAGKVHNRDCLALMRTMRAESVDMVFADPPFNLKKKYSSYKDDMPFDDYIAWTGEWIQEACRILKPDGNIFVYNIPKLLIYTAEILNRFAHFRHWIAWNANGQPLGKTLMPAHYGILFYGKSKSVKFYDVRAPHKTCRACNVYLKDYGGKEHLRHKFGYLVSDVWDDIHRVRHNSKRIESHPCQLPVHLVERLVLMSTDENDIVFDPFCGGGSAAVAAKQMGRKYIGAETDKNYCLTANKIAVYGRIRSMSINAPKTAETVMKTWWQSAPEKTRGDIAGGLVFLGRLREKFSLNINDHQTKSGQLKGASADNTARILRIFAEHRAFLKTGGRSGRAVQPGINGKYHIALGGD